MNAIDLLIQDHQVVRGLFQRFQAAQEDDATETMVEIAAQVFDELEIHTTVEEEVFYPAVRKEVDDMDEDLDEGLQEHHVVDVLMNEMREIEDGSDEWVAKMTVLIENVEHHAGEEEEDMFPEVQEKLSDDRLDELGAELTERQQTAKADLQTKADLYRKAREQEIEGRSDMTKAELAEAVGT